ncbi:hypothetical protein DRE_06799 [Drechslerella stenobrocha 248]|uniref:amidase n=1 Tax=Drechslerella stenobrocha 248 TaxID=1043628 RepID=W7HK86_9PEZI|nr:hypothetical protein DRE_06799 [Drechslerella stenobrocha 248]
MEPIYIGIARRKRAEQLSRIPVEWQLKQLPAESVSDVRGIPRESGILSAREIEITETFDAIDLAAKIRSRTYSCYEVAVAFCKRAAIAQQLLSCLTEIFFDKALERAKELDKHLERHGLPLGPLHGVPVSLKDTENVPGYDTSCGMAGLCFRPATKASAIVLLLEKAGAVLYCKTNIPQTLMALDSHNQIWGRTLNPLNRRLTPGGSSGGESALIAMRGSLLGVGSDIGGSIRIPAMCTGVYGIKPTSLRLASHIGAEGFSIPGSHPIGISPSVGPLGTSLRSCELLLNLAIDGKLWETEPHVLFSPWRTIEPKMRQMRFLVLMTDNIVTPLPPVRRLLRETTALLKYRGHKVVVLENPPPFLKEHNAIFNRTIGFDGGNHIIDLLDSTEEAKVPCISGRLARRNPATIQQLYERYAKKEEFTINCLGLWKSADGEDFDAIIFPVAPHPTLRHDEWQYAGYTSIFNVLDWPAGAVPARNVTREDLEAPLGIETGDRWDKLNRTKLWNKKEDYLGTPLSLQIVGRKMQEEELVRAMHVVDEVLAETRDATIRDHKL